MASTALTADSRATAIIQALHTPSQTPRPDSITGLTHIDLHRKSVDQQVFFHFGGSAIQKIERIEPDRFLSAYFYHRSVACPTDEDIEGMIEFLPQAELKDAFRDICRGLIKLWTRIIGTDAQHAIDDWIVTAELHADPELLATLEEQEAAFERGEGIDWDDYKQRLLGS